jgi:phenylpropionate dioxygenase-like ring-hydroxylating dioxygenase large terminal subunit
LDSSNTPPLRDVWYFAIPSAALKPGKMLGKTIMDEPLLLGRAKDGTAFALLDICPHRGIPLRYGRFDGCEVECCYHGWRFAPSGACTAIPPVLDEQIPSLSKIRVRAYPVEERHGGIWVFFGDNPAMAPTLPDLPELAGQRPKIAESMVFEGAIDHAVIGLMDPAHGSYVHKSWYWRKAPRLKQKEFGPAPWGFTMKRHAPSANSRAYRILGGGETLTTEINFRLPGVRWEQIKAGRHSMCHLTSLTPLDGGRTEINHLVFWTMPWLTPFTPLLRPFVRTFLGQDRTIVQRQQEGLRYQPQLLLLGDPDVQARWYYRLKNEFLRAREEQREFVNPIKDRTLRWRS